MITRLSNKNLFLAAMPHKNGIAIKVIDKNNNETETRISWEELLNNAIHNEDSEKLQLIDVTTKNICILIGAKKESIEITVHDTETITHDLETKDYCGIQTTWIELIENCITNGIENLVYAHKMKNNAKDVLLHIKKANEIEKEIVYEGEEMKTIVKSDIHITPGITPTETENEKLVELAELQSTADELGQFILESMEDKELKKLEKKLNDIKEKISKRQMEIGLANAEAERNDVLAQLASKMTELGKEITDDRWGPNQFTKGKKLEFSNGTVSLLRSTTTRRKINVKKLLDINPIKVSEFAEKGKLGLTISDAGETMSENEINEVSDKTISHTYELYVKGRRYE